MAYDEELAERVRRALADRPEIDEKRMFGGLCFTSRGNMVAGINGDTLMARVGPDQHADALSRPHARPMDFTGKPMKGIVYVDAPGVATDEELTAWVELCFAFVDTLQAKA